jgi:hypothetical protein
MPIWKFQSASTSLDLVFSDSIGFDDSFSSQIGITLSLTDTIGFNDILSINLTFTMSFEDSIGFNDTLYYGDFIVSWRCRTKIPNCAFGGEEYGGGQGYGGGAARDISQYLLEIYKISTGALIRSEYITIDDPEDPDYIYVYSKAMNIADNISFVSDLTFVVYQIDSSGNFSVGQTISTS